MSCLQAPTIPLISPAGITLGLPNVGIAFTLNLSECCQFNIPVAVSTQDLLDILGLSGVTPTTLGITAEVLAPINDLILDINKVLMNASIDCPLA